MDDTVPSPRRDPADSAGHDRIGPYRVLDVLGEGGMGTVYLAEESNPRRRVALKVIKLGMDSKAVMSRFEQERQALALMDHEGIAKVYACGTTDRGQPWFAMELVKGVPLDQYCEQQRLSLRDRIGLLQQVCAAVQHAHHKGVVHRDLKPGNVLVADEGGRRQVKIIDFGLAKAMGQRLVEATLFTEAGQVVGTPEYMAPEQADLTNQDVDTRADVYSLGVILYKLLCGELPFASSELRGAGLLGIQRILREVEPPRPSAKLTRAGASASEVAAMRRTSPVGLRKALQGDLDWVALKALEKERNRRYDTANALANDLERYLNHEPLAAGPPSALYRMKKALRRHRAEAATAAAVTLASLAFGGLALWQKQRADQAAMAEAKARVEATILAAEKGRTVESFQQLAGVVRLEQAVAKEQRLGPPWPSSVAGMESWMRDEAEPLVAMRGRIAAAIDELRAGAVARTPEHVAADRLASPAQPAFAAKNEMVQALRRAQAGGEARAAAAGDPDLEGRSAGMLVQSGLLHVAALRFVTMATAGDAGTKRSHRNGQEERALALALAARARSDAGDGSIARCAVHELAAWAMLANGRHDEAEAEAAAAIATAAPGRRAAYEQDRELLIAKRRELPALLAAAEGSLQQLSQAIDAHRTWRFAADAEGAAAQFLHDALVRLLSGLDTFAVTQKAGVEKRLRWARALADGLCREHPRARVTWASARAAIARADGATASALYAGRRIRLAEESVHGLVPIGMNPVTKLWEFYDLYTAWDGVADPASMPIPEHLPDGSIAMTADTGIVFALLPGGAFLVGAQAMVPDGPNFEPTANKDEAPAPVTLAPFLCARHEVTIRQWQRLAGAWPVAWAEGKRFDGDPVPIGGAHPATMIDWHAATLWMERHGMSLPTEAQWEHGARGGTRTSWWPGNALADLEGCANVNDRAAVAVRKKYGEAVEFADGFANVSPVGFFRANPFGLFDVHGNVAELCRDGTGTYGSQRDGDGYRPDGATLTVVMRGGAFNATAADSRSAYRGSIGAAVSNGYVGVRPVRELGR